LKLQREVTKSDEQSEDAKSLKRWGAALKQDLLFKSVMNDTVPQETEDGSFELTPYQKELLGTRAELKTSIEQGEFSEPIYRGAWSETLPLLADIEECRERCTIGAQYVRLDPSHAPKLHCLNKDHYLEKLARGEREWQEKAEAQRQQTDQENLVMIEALADGLSEPLAKALSLALLNRASFQKVNPDPENNWQTRPYSYIPQTMIDIAEDLDLKLQESDQSWMCFDQGPDFKDMASEAVKGLSGAMLRQVAARLITHTIRGGVDALEICEIVGAIEGGNTGKPDRPKDYADPLGPVAAASSDGQQLDQYREGLPDIEDSADRLLTDAVKQGSIKISPERFIAYVNAARQLYDPSETTVRIAQIAEALQYANRDPEQVLADFDQALDQPDQQDAPGDRELTRHNAVKSAKLRFLEVLAIAEQELKGGG
jgi:hypothetical protein